MYSLEILSNGKQYKETFIENKAFISVVDGEEFSIRFWNGTQSKVQVRLSIDGLDVLTGEPASLYPCGRMLVVNPGATTEVKGWPDTNNNGISFVFTAGNKCKECSVKSNRGVISAAIFGEDPAMGPFVRPSSEVSKRKIYDSDDLSPWAMCGVDTVAVGLGRDIPQRIERIQGLKAPKLISTLSIRYEDNAALEAILAKMKANPYPKGPGKEIEHQVLRMV